MESLGVVLQIVFMGIVALFSVLVYLAYFKIEWFTGSLETHSALQLWFKVQEWNKLNSEAPLNLVWWDPSREPIPPWRSEHPNYPRHGEPIRRDTIYMMIPNHLRHRVPSAWHRLHFWKRSSP